MRYCCLDAIELVVFHESSIETEWLRMRRTKSDSESKVSVTWQDEVSAVGVTFDCYLALLDKM